MSTELEFETPTSICLAKHFARMGRVFSKDLLDFPEPIWQILEYKHLFAHFLKTHQFDCAPSTYVLEEASHQQVLNTIADHGGAWILKPSLQNNGQNIHIFDNLAAVQAHYETKQRLGGPHVLQAYIHPPHLLKGPQFGHKYSIRMFLCLLEPYAAFLYPDGYFNVALKAYDRQVISSQLTNEHLAHEVLNVVQVPSYQYDLFQDIFPKILKITQEISKNLSLLSQGKVFKIGLFGLDFMLDATEKVYLLEANHGPCFPLNPEHPLQEKLYQNFWSSLVSEIILPMKETRNPVLDRWISLY